MKERFFKIEIGDTIKISEVKPIDVPILIMGLLAPAVAVHVNGTVWCRNTTPQGALGWAQTSPNVGLLIPTLPLEDL